MANHLTRAALLALCLVFVTRIEAQQGYRVCKDFQVGFLWTDRASCDEAIQFAYQCDVVFRGPECVPPATYAHPASPAWTQGATFAGDGIDKGVTVWRWRGTDREFITPRYFLRSAHVIPQ